MFNNVLDFLNTTMVFLLTLFLIGGIVTFLIHALLHSFFKMGWVKSPKFALSMSDMSRYKLLSKCRSLYFEKKRRNASDEYLSMVFKCATASRLIPIRTRIEVDSMLQVDYFYSTYFNLADFNASVYLEMYDDFVKGKYKLKEKYSKDVILREKLPEKLRDPKTFKELRLLVDNEFLDDYGQPIIGRKTHNNPTGRTLQQIILACYFVHPDNYTNLFGELWGIPPSRIKSHKCNASNCKKTCEYIEEFSAILGRDVTIPE